MRCVESCNYREMPNNMPRLKSHIEHCDRAAPADQVTVIWEDGEFVAVQGSLEEAVEIPLVLQAYNDPEVPDPVEPVEPPVTTMTAPKKRAAKKKSEEDEF